LSWAKAQVASAYLVSATVLWSGEFATVWSGVVWKTAFAAIVVLVSRAINGVASLFGTDSLWAATVVLDTFIDLIGGAISHQRSRATRLDLFEGNAIFRTVLHTQAWEAGGWDTVPWGIFTGGSVDVPSVTNWNFFTQVVDTFFRVRTWSSGGWSRGGRGTR